MEITKLGIITAFKNVGLFLTTISFAEINAEPIKILYTGLIFACLTVPSDLYLLNKSHENGLKNGKKSSSKKEKDKA